MTTTITVSSTAALYDALANATGGEIIKLAAGSYGAFSLDVKSGFDRTFPSNVTITSADPLNPATFSSVKLDSVANLTLDGLVFDHTFKAGDPSFMSPFQINGGDHVTVTNSTFDGDVATGVSTVANGYGTGYALVVRGATNVTVSNNEMHNFQRGLVVDEVTGIKVTGNDISNMRTDGMDFSQVKGVLIEGNNLHDFRRSLTSLDHCDMIQFFTNNTTAPSTDIVIRGNVLDIGNGTYTQSIFMRNELVDWDQAGSEMNYRNVTIEQNVITNAHLNGIMVGQTTGLKVQHNTVLHADGVKADGVDPGVEIPAIVVASGSTSVVVTNNATGSLIGWSGQSGWTVGHNAFVQDQDADKPGYYGNVFVSSSLSSPNGVHDYIAVPGGLLDQLDAGADATLMADGSSPVHAMFQTTEDEGGFVQTRFFDASYSISELGALPEGTTFLWTFGDGTTATGMKVGHNFAEGGSYDVSLTVKLPTGQTDVTHSVVAVQDSNILTLGNDGAFDVYEDGAMINLAKSSAACTYAGIQLNTTGVSASVDRSHVADIIQAE
ncbi:MAG: right-handed parallel beta-helix repeat-containing protein, partial [Candidatus Saccharibacteria bacterium]|nr:right-handed parallel beta-helix repeat-containing protein [Pseudorhodobacter sp.]